MTHHYKITGMTCTSCSNKVSTALSHVSGITGVDIDLKNGEAALNMDKHISTATLQAALKSYPNYSLSDAPATAAPAPAEAVMERSWFATYKPVLLIFGYVSVLSLIAGWSATAFDWSTFMRIFMSGFFLTFSFFKMLDLSGFADSYSSYDIIAKKFPSWGFIYGFIELGLGIGYALDVEPLVINAVTFVVMSVSLVGVMQSVLSKQKIRCACLGTGFDLPMSTITIIEDALMILMSAFMLIKML